MPISSSSSRRRAHREATQRSSAAVTTTPCCSKSSSESTNAAEAILNSPGHAATRYRDNLARVHLPYQRITAAGHAALVGRPRAIAAVGRVLTAPVFGSALAGGWGIFWNELLDGAAPGGARRVATASTWFGRAVTARTEVSRWFSSTFNDPKISGPGERAGRGSI